MIVQLFWDFQVDFFFSVEPNSCHGMWVHKHETRQAWKFTWPDPIDLNFHTRRKVDSQKSWWLVRTPKIIQIASLNISWDASILHRHQPIKTYAKVMGRKEEEENRKRNTIHIMNEIKCKWPIDSLNRLQNFGILMAFLPFSSLRFRNTFFVPEQIEWKMLE